MFESIWLLGTQQLDHLGLPNPETHIRLCFLRVVVYNLGVWGGGGNLGCLGCKPRSQNSKACSVLGSPESMLSA